MRALLLAALMLTACRFDTSGTATSGDDDAVVDGNTGGAIDGAPHGTPDATSLPETLDAGPSNPTVECGNITCGGSTVCCSTWQGLSCTTPDACSGSTQTCDGPEDCPGQLCCGYFGSTSCQDSCLGGDTVCTDADQCGGDDCCEHSDGPSTCGFVCF